MYVNEKHYVLLDDNNEIIGMGEDIEEKRLIPLRYYTGTTDTLKILLQRNGFSKETSKYIIECSDEYVVKTDNGIKIKNIILECGKESVCREVKDVQFNVPELFI